ncbi:MAG: GTP 3',8-cyclase MoaA [Cellvibrionales bacterium]|nr:GTP 3',8-cyclase MoaA [Cellvibrionales bacterium]
MRPLLDPHGRAIRYLRLSITDRCDFRCRYCMPAKMHFAPRRQLLDLAEYVLLARAFVELGVRKIRLTGGEPLVRADVLQMVHTLSQIPDLDELTMTTNGSQMARYAAGLRAAGLSRLNISLDSLDADTFRHLTRTGDLRRVLAGIEAARAAGFRRIRINAVIIKGRNEQQILPLLDFCLERGLDLCFIEEMPLGDIGDDRNRPLELMPSNAVRRQIAARYRLHPLGFSTGGPARYWGIAGQRSRIGFISPHSDNFCAACNRVRVTATGRLLLCLGHENALDLRALLRRHPGQRAPLKTAIRQALARKPARHYFSPAAQAQTLRFMNATGG